MFLEGKVALITGSVRGTGAGIARVFVREGARVVLNQVRDEGNPQQVLDAIHAQGGGQAIFVKADIGDEAQVNAMVQQAERAFGTVEDTANVALFLASELGSFVTGLYIPVCSGQVME